MEKETKRKEPIMSTKSKFILDLPLTMPAKDVVAKGAKANIFYDDNYVYSVRATARMRAAARKNATGPKKHGPGRPTGRQARSPEQLLKAVAAILGYSKAMAVLDEAERDALAML
jgi:hypothetical protein